MSKSNKLSAILPMLIILAIAIAMAVLVAADASADTPASAQNYMYGGNLPPWVDQHSAVNTIPTVIATSSLWGTPMNNPYNGSLPAWIDYNIQVAPNYDNGPVVLTITGKVDHPMSLKMSQLKAYGTSPFFLAYTKNGEPRTISADAAISLNSLLDSAGVQSGAKTVRFIGRDGYPSEISLATIRGASNSVIAIMDDGTLRNIVPGQSSSKWAKDLVKIEVQ